jgi:HSP20 family protein
MNLIPFRTKRSTELEPGSLHEFRNEMNRLFEGFFNRPWIAPGWFESAEPGRWMPAIDLSETDKQIRIRAEIPGMDANDVDVSVSEDRLVIAGEKKSAEERTTDGWTHRESRYGGFSRAIPLPEHVDPSTVTAHYDKGVLTVELAKTATARSRKVPVVAGK